MKQVLLRVRAMKSKAKSQLIAAYIGALGLSAIRLSGDNPTRIEVETAPDPLAADVGVMLWFVKAGHAELVMSSCQNAVHADHGRPDGWIDLSAAEVRERLLDIATSLGASWRSTAEVLATAGAAVDELERHVEALNKSGGLAPINAGYKSYRLSMQSTGEPAVNYSAYLQGFKLKMISRIAENVAAGIDKFAGLASVVPGTVFWRPAQHGDTSRSSRVYVNRGWSNHSLRKSE